MLGCWENVGDVGEAGASGLGLEICKGPTGSLSRDVEERRLDALGLTGLPLAALADPCAAVGLWFDIIGLEKSGRTGDDMLACRKDPINGLSPPAFAPLDMDSFGLRVNVALRPRFVSSKGFSFSLSLSLRRSVAGVGDCCSSRARWRDNPVTLRVS